MYKMCRKTQPRNDEYKIISGSNAVINHIIRSNTIKIKILILFSNIFLFKVLSRLAEKYKSLATYAIRVLCDFLTEPSPLLFKLYRHTNQKLEEEEHMSFVNEDWKRTKEYRAFQIFEKLRDSAIEGLCKLVFHFCGRICINPIDIDHYVFVWIRTRNVLKLYLLNCPLDLLQDILTIGKLSRLQSF